MLTIVWNPHGFNLIKVLEKDRKFNAGYYIPGALDPLPQRRSIEAGSNERQLLVYADNVRRILPSYQLNMLTRIQ
jgi:hypothetical protein